MLFSFNCFSAEHTTNVYRTVYTGVDYLNHEYLIILDGQQTLIYSTTQLFTKNNRVSSIILQPDEFSRIVREFTKK